MDLLLRHAPLLRALVVAWVAFRLARAILRRGGGPRHTRQAACSCGWRGAVSRYRPVCPRCGAHLGS